MAEIRRKLVIVGDGACGKTCTLFAFMRGTFPEVYVPTVFENHVADIGVGYKHVELDFWDTAGQVDFQRLRPLSYPGSHVVLIAYAIDSPDSLDNVKADWIYEVSHFCEGLPIVLVGLKGDLRNDAATIKELHRLNQTPIIFKEGLQMAKSIGASAFVECSAKTHSGVSEVYLAAGTLALSDPRRNGKAVKCAVM
ncbi:GTP-binding protein rhoA [Polyplosphaeria fusca]|uniref:GTP-binding protein rhoA n=1 Tax=Polyplosphaeria fusca TaxID=682080 RepID=A0A9P4QTX6_9PLEO|nr:GTP-binding protein rhoA [Polyplosphaeria fusca]